MPTHEFGIMEHSPTAKQYFDKYEPQKYHCISVDDELLTPLLETLFDTDFFWHSTKTVGKGLAYCGITLLSPSMSASMLHAIQDTSALKPLATLLEEACQKEKFVIHFGI